MLFGQWDVCVYYNEYKEIEGNYIPPMSERRELSMSKLSLWLTYSARKNAKKKTTIKKRNVCQLHNKYAITSMDDNNNNNNIY